MDLTTIFYYVDNFCKCYEQYGEYKLLPGYKYFESNDYQMSLSEIMATVIYYGTSSHEFKSFKVFYKYKYNELKSAFPGLVSYGRLIELRQEIVLPLNMFLLALLATCTGKSYIDSTAIKACHIKREWSHSVLKNLAAKGKSTNGWFYGFKLHAVVTEHSEFVNLLITPGNIADNDAWLIEQLTQELTGKLFGDKGYIINPELWHKLYQRGLQLVHGIRSNMKNKLMLMQDKMDLRKRANISESVFSHLNDRMALQYTRNRSVYGFVCNILCILVAYQLWASNRTRNLHKKFKTQKNTLSAAF